MLGIQDDLKTADKAHVFDVPVKLTRQQLEQMLLAIGADQQGLVSETSRADTADAGISIAVKKAMDLIEITKRRSRLVSAANLFADPAWFILLDLFVRQHQGLKTSVSSACHASFSPVTTALRHIAILTERNIIQRQYDPVDHRRVYLELTVETSEEIQRILLTDDYTELSIAS
jgi:hypothetical protein